LVQKAVDRKASRLPGKRLPPVKFVSGGLLDDNVSVASVDSFSLVNRQYVRTAADERLPPKESTMGGVLRVRAVPNIGYDPRVRGTPFEAHILRYYREVCEVRGRPRGRNLFTGDFTLDEYRTFVCDPIISNLAPGLASQTLVREPGAEDATLYMCDGLAVIPPDEIDARLPRARISDWEISQAIISLGKYTPPPILPKPSSLPPEMVEHCLAQAWLLIDSLAETDLEPATIVQVSAPTEASTGFGPSSYDDEGFY
jgi:hypothetical protein